MAAQFDFRQIQSLFVKFHKLGIHSCEDLRDYEDKLVGNIQEGLQQLHQTQDVWQLFMKNSKDKSLYSKQSKSNKVQELLSTISKLFPEEISKQRTDHENINNELKKQSKSTQTDSDKILKNTQVQTDDQERYQTKGVPSVHVTGETGGNKVHTPEKTCEQNEGVLQNSVDGKVLDQARRASLPSKLIIMDNTCSPANAIPAVVDRYGYITNMNGKPVLIGNRIPGNLGHILHNGTYPRSSEISNVTASPNAIEIFPSSSKESSNVEDKMPLKFDESEMEKKNDDPGVHHYDNVKSPGAPPHETRHERRKRKDRERHSIYYRTAQQKQREDPNYAEELKTKWKKTKMTQRIKSKSQMEQPSGNVSQQHLIGDRQTRAQESLCPDSTMDTGSCQQVCEPTRADVHEELLDFDHTLVQQQRPSNEEGQKCDTIETTARQSAEATFVGHGPEGATPQASSSHQRFGVNPPQTEATDLRVRQPSRTVVSANHQTSCRTPQPM